MLGGIGAAIGCAAVREKRYLSMFWHHAMEMAKISGGLRTLYSRLEENFKKTRFYEEINKGNHEKYRGHIIAGRFDTSGSLRSRLASCMKAARETEECHEKQQTAQAQALASPHEFV